MLQYSKRVLGWKETFCFYILNFQERKTTVNQLYIAMSLGWMPTSGSVSYLLLWLLGLLDYICEELVRNLVTSVVCFFSIYFPSKVLALNHTCFLTLLWWSWAHRKKIGKLCSHFILAYFPSVSKKLSKNSNMHILYCFFHILSEIMILFKNKEREKKNLSMKFFRKKKKSVSYNKSFVHKNFFRVSKYAMLKKVSI